MPETENIIRGQQTLNKMMQEATGKSLTEKGAGNKNHGLANKFVKSSKGNHPTPVQATLDYTDDNNNDDSFPDHHATQSKAKESGKDRHAESVKSSSFVI